ncbi:helix-turn-helix domain-containing protein [Paenibacillus albidus]|uniref:helix-turn-helix domain-containing protein n=1 Tax=Paenibacillus albidus TaxID=2041023 RepID=UPI002034AC4F|nr:helix-turn-helix transcriptional regulator [Paenibacillus albidus]
MEPTVTIRDHLAVYLTGQEMSINQFAILSGINSGTLSRIINGNQPIAMGHLEQITRGMGLAEDYFYNLYVDECFFHSSPTWRRLRPFIVRAAAAGRLDCIERIVGILLDNLAYAPMLFDVAEELYQQGNKDAAALLYENVSASERYQHSERLAVCQYRLFLIALGDDQNVNMRAANQFEAYVDRLDEADQLDALKHLADLYSSLHQWRKVNELAKELYRRASIQYGLWHCSDCKSSSGRMPTRPLCYYILYSHLLRSVVYEEQGDYIQALEIVSLYADGSWIREDTEEVKRTVKQFQEWATANTYLYRLMAGQQEVLPEYVEYISTQPNEIFTALYKIIQSANQYHWNVDHILERFSTYIPYRIHRTEFGDYNQQIMADQHARFLSELAAYYLHNNRYGGIDFILQSLEFSAKINNESIVIQCVDLFEQYRYAAEEEEQKKYKLLIREVRMYNEKGTHKVTSFC